MMPNVPELTFLLHAIGQCTSSSIMYSRSRPSEIEILLPVRVFLVKKIEVKIKKGSLEKLVGRGDELLLSSLES